MTGGSTAIRAGRLVCHGSCVECGHPLVQGWAVRVIRHRGFAHTDCRRFLQVASTYPLLCVELDAKGSVISGSEQVYELPAQQG